MAEILVTHFQSLEMKYCSSSNLCSQSSTILSVYRCSIKQDRILHTNTQYEQNWSNVTIKQHSGKFMAERVCSELLLQCHLQCLKQQQRLSYEMQMQNVSNINKATICSICFLLTERLSSWHSGPNISNTSTHMGSPFRMCLQAVWMTDSQASFRARSMR